MAGMADKRQKQPNYNPEFVDKAVDLVLSSSLPDKQVAEILGVNASTLASWKSKRLHSTAAQPQSSLEMEVDEENGKAINADTAMDKPSRQKEDASKLMKEQPFNNSGFNSALDEKLDDVAEFAVMKIEHLKKENQKLKKDKEILQEALLILAGG